MNVKQDYDVVTLDKKVEYRKCEEAGRTLPRKTKATNVSDNIVLEDSYMFIQHEMTLYNHLLQTVNDEQWKSFDPGINLIIRVNCPNVTLEDKGVFRGEEEKVNDVYTRELCNVVVRGCKCMFSDYYGFDKCDDFGISSELCCTLGSLFSSYQLVSLASLILAVLGMSRPSFQLIDSPYNNLSVPCESTEIYPPNTKGLFIVMSLLDLAHQQRGCWLSVCTVKVGRVRWLAVSIIEVGLVRIFVMAFYSMFSMSTIGKYHLLDSETAPCLSYDIEALVNRLGVKQNEATVDQYFNDYEVVTPKQDVLFCCVWLFNWINVISVAFCPHVFDPGRERLEVVHWSFDGVSNDGFFCVGIYDRNNAVTFFSKLLKENLRVAIQWFRATIIIYVFDPGGSLLLHFINVDRVSYAFSRKIGSMDNRSEVYALRLVIFVVDPVVST